MMAMLVLVPILIVGSVGMASATHIPRCGGQFDSRSLYWRTNSPSVDQVLARLPINKRQISGNMISLNYAVDASGRLVNQSDFYKQWNYIFGSNTSTGYGQLIRGAWAPGSESSWGNSTRINRKNLSECIVDGTVPAICMGIPTSQIGGSSLGQHSGWMVFDKSSTSPKSLVNLKVGGRACLSYRLMASSNFDFTMASNVKFPGFASAPEGYLPPNDHICEDGQRSFNTGKTFSTRIVLGGGAKTTTAGRIFNHFKDDMLKLDCSSRFRVLNEMHAFDVRTNELSRGVWYRVEHELKLNSNFDPNPGQLSGAYSRIWIYNDKTGALITSFEKRNSFNFEGVGYPLMPRRDSTGRIEGMFLSMQYSSSTAGTRDFAIAVNAFELYMK
jgi:hypothetical protein